MTADLTDEQQAEFEALLEYIKRNRGFDFTAYKRPTLVRRITKRMNGLNINSYSAYAARLEEDPDEFTALFDAILINVTSFFRDPPAWEFLAAEVIPRIVEQKAPGDPIRVWSTGCATGEEAYTISMLLAETLGEGWFGERVKIYATDLDEPALGVGRHGRYSPEAVEPIPQAFREKYLEQSNGQYVFRNDLRRAVVFGRHNLLHDPPISRIDLLSARNTLMYFSPDAQTRVLENFHFCLNANGFLFLGKSEILLTRSNLFVPVDLRRRVFQPTPKAAFRERVLELVQETRDMPAGNPGEVPVARFRDAAFDAAPNASIILDASGRVALANLHARTMFGLSARDVGHAFHDLEMSFRPVDLRTPVEEVLAGGHLLWVRDVELRQTNGETRFVDFQLAPLTGADGRPNGVTINVVDITRYRTLQASMDRARADLETAYEELQATTEELETTNEELQSTNEELETTNEELQSTNEELETMNEELQSTNEELETMNDEMRLRTDDLNAVNEFLDSILGSLHAAVVVLDPDLHVRAWNAAAEDLWGLRQDEAAGQHFLNLDFGLPLDELSKPLRDAMSNGDDVELGLAATNRRGRKVDVQVRIRPMESDADGRGLVVLMEAHEP
jgi:two-component system, chemotaxis family, CheB/CheR fusion protein